MAASPSLLRNRGLHIDYLGHAQCSRAKIFPPAEAQPVLVGSPFACGRSPRDPGRLQEETTRTWRSEANRDTWSSTPECWSTPRSTPLEELDPVIRLFEGISLGSLSELAQEEQNSHRRAWPRTRAGHLKTKAIEFAFYASSWQDVSSRCVFHWETPHQVS